MDRENGQGKWTKKWAEKMQKESGRRKWIEKMGRENGHRKWTQKMYRKNGQRKWTEKLTEKMGEENGQRKQTEKMDSDFYGQEIMNADVHARTTDTDNGHGQLTRTKTRK